jgi:hypothetical protein
MFEGLLSDHNMLIVVADSLRLDVARSSRLPFLDRHCVIHECDASANFTYPAHAALMAGFTPLPDGREFNVGDWRVSRLWRSTSGRARDGAVGLTFSGPSLISASEAAGRTTVGFGGVQFFDPASGGVTLATHFRDFRFAGVSATEALIAESSWSTASQLPAFPSISGLARPTEPWTIFVNSAAPHFPYACDTSPVVDRDVDFLHFAGTDAIERRTSPKRPPHGFMDWGLAKQAAALGALDSGLSREFQKLRPLGHPTVLVLLADHGEAFGDDGYVGHGVNHSSVLRVPLWVGLIPPG